MNLLYLPLVGLFFVSAGLKADNDEYSFDTTEFEPKTFELTGYIEFEPEYAKANQEGTLYQLQYFGLPPEETLDQYTGTLELEGYYRKGNASLNFLAHSEIVWDNFGEEQDHKLYEGNFSYQARPGLVFDAGKKAMRWGKGYAWNPVAFVERAKDAGDPDLAREGYWVIAADWVKTFEGPLQTFAITTILLPTNDHINQDFGRTGHKNLAIKLYFLYRDVDIDLMYLTQGSFGSQVGMDFSKNLAPNFEIHGEFAYFNDISHRTVTQDCRTGKAVVDDEISYLLGLRYRTSSDITFLLEYYYNGRGNTLSQQQQFYRCVHIASETGDEDLLNQLPLNTDLDRGPFTKPNPMQKYVGFRTWWEEPWDMLYLTTALQIFYNVEDHSYSITPELLYEGFDDVEIRLRGTMPVGDTLTEWGEKPNQFKLEAQIRLFF
ncbi:MAG: hypothetical protein P8Z78_14450 [Gammaproteobacteria bacterium]